MIGGSRGRRKPTRAITDTMGKLENDKRISLTYSQTLCYSRTWRTKVVCSSLMHTQTFTQTRRCRRTCKSACHRVRRLAALCLGYWNIPVNLDDALRWYGKRIDKEIGIMSARSAQRTRWRRWRMGRDIAGGKDRETEG